MDTAEKAKEAYEALDAVALDIYQGPPEVTEQMLVDAVDKLLSLIKANPDAGMRVGQRWIREQRAGVREPEPVR
jgi:hypothetical protein